MYLEDAMLALYIDVEKSRNSDIPEFCIKAIDGGIDMIVVDGQDTSIISDIKKVCEQIVQSRHRVHHLHAIGFVGKTFVDLDDWYNIFDRPQVRGSRAPFNKPSAESGSTALGIGPKMRPP